MNQNPFLLLFFILGTFSSAFAQDPNDLWQPQDEKAWLAAHHLDAKAARRGVLPSVYRTLRVNRTNLRQLLQAAPREFSADARQRTAEITLPLSRTAFARFSVQESPIMEDQLAARHPDIRTFVAQGIDDPSLTARLDVTPQGFHALILSPLLQIYIDPYAPEDPDLCIVFAKRDYAASKPFNCLVQGQNVLSPEVAARAEKDTLARPTGANLRTYRLAVAATGEYTQAVGGGTVLGALGAIITTVNRVSAVFEKELAIRLKLVNGEENIIFTDAATDGFTNSNANTLIGESQSKIDAVIGNANYDIGHTFSTGAGGLAGLGVVCRTNQKASGVTGTSNPVGDPYDIDFVIHEMGHEFGANHPFNGTSSNCSGANRNGPTAYEPGSGTTIMAYAGICTPQDLAPHSDDYFHTISYDEIDTYTSTGAGSGCPVITATGNNPPSLNALSSYTIPQGTPFALTAQAADADGDLLTYCWEEFDKGTAQDPTASPRDNGTSPIFRTYAPTVSPTRLFPSLPYILNNANVPPATVGSLATGEFLPATNRTMTFRVTARDNHPGGGGSNYGLTTITSTITAGPFALTSPNAVATFAGGASLPVTWNVANTSVSPVSCANVKISLSTDGGQTFPFVLAASTPNDGAETVTLPSVANVATTQGRIKIEAVGNIFFDISDAALTITSSNSAPVVTITNSTGLTIKRGTPTAVTTTVGTATDANGNPLTVALSNLPYGANVTAALSSGNISLTGTADCRLTTTTTSRTYPITVTVTDSIGSTTAATVNLTIQPNSSPTLGTYNDPSQILSGATITVSPSAPAADASGNLPASPYLLSPTTLPGGGTLTINQNTGVVTVATVSATTPGTYPVRITVQDTCGAAIVRGFNFSIAASSVVLSAGSTSAPVTECPPGNGAVDPGENVTVNLIINNTGGVATSNLTATLQSSGGVTPTGTATQNYGAIPALGGSVSRSFTFTASGTCGGTVTATLALQDGATSYGNITYVYQLGVLATVLAQNFDAVAAPALPSGWTSTTAAVSGGTAGTPWATVNSGVIIGPPNSAFAPDLAGNGTAGGESSLVSPVINITTASARLQFSHLYDFEAPNYDGGVLEIKIGAGSFTDIVTLGGTFVQGGYSGTLFSSAKNPLGGRAGWVSSNASNTPNTPVIVNLPASAAGQAVQFRWRLGFDESFAARGWTVDSVSITDGFVCAAPCTTAPAFTSALPPAAVVDLPYSHTFTASGSPAPQFMIASGALPLGLTLNQTSGLLSGTPTTPQAGTSVSVSAINGVNPSATQTFSIIVGNRFSHYIAPYGFSVGNAANTADPDADGLKNVLEYALNLNAASNDSVAGRPVVSTDLYSGTPYLTIRYPRLTTNTDLDYIAQVSPDLINWTDVATSLLGGATTGPGFVSEPGTVPLLNVTARDTVPATANLRFIRLKVIQH